MLAVIITGGKQYLVKEGAKIQVEKLDIAEGQPVVFDRVLLVGNEDGQQVNTGAPVVSGATVEGTVTKQGRTAKVTSIKYKSKVRYRRKKGHRQAYTAVTITKISA